MPLKPDTADLLAAALALFRDEILPALPPEKRYAGLMVASALAMAGRELGADGAPMPQATALYGEPMPADAFARRLAGDIAAGRFDAAGPERDAAFAALRAINDERLAITAPKRRAAT